MSELEILREQFEQVKSLGLALNMQRGQPSDNDFNLANPMLTIVDASDVVTPGKVAVRNYPGGIAGIATVAHKSAVSFFSFIRSSRFLNRYRNSL